MQDFFEGLGFMNFRRRVQLLKFFCVAILVLALVPALRQWFGLGALTMREIIWNTLAMSVVTLAALVVGTQHALELSRGKR